MSLLLDALKRAEQAKRAKSNEAAPEAVASFESSSATDKRAPYTGPERRELALTEHEPIDVIPSAQPAGISLPASPSASVATAQIPIQIHRPAPITPTTRSGIAPAGLKAAHDRDSSPSALIGNAAGNKPGSTTGSAVDRASGNPASQQKPIISKSSTAPWLLPAIAVGTVAVGAAAWFGWQAFAPSILNTASRTPPASPANPVLPPALPTTGQIASSADANKLAAIATASVAEQALPPLYPPLLPPALAEAPLPRAMPIKRLSAPAAELTERELLAQSLRQSPVSREAPVRLRLSQSIDAPKVSPELNLAYAALTRGDYVQAKKLYSQVVQTLPLNLDAQLGLAAAAARSGDNTTAARHYRRVLELDPRNSMAIAGLLAVSESTKPETLEAELKALISKDPNSAALQFSLGNLYASERRWTEAQQAFFEAYRLDADNADYLYNLAVSLDQLNQSRLALDYYQKSLAQAAKTGAQFDRNAAIRRVAELQNSRPAS